MLTATGQDGRPAGSTGPIGRGAEYFPFAISRRPLSGEILLISPVRELGGTSTIHLAVAGGGRIRRPRPAPRAGLGPPQGGAVPPGAPRRTPPPHTPPPAPPPPPPAPRPH